LAQWEGSVIRRGSVTTSARGEAAPGKGKSGDDASWTLVGLTRILLGQKIKKIHVMDSVSTNGR
jgi:hypothetical protein